MGGDAADAGREYGVRRTGALRQRAGAVGSFVRPNAIDGHFWHSNYWNPLFDMHCELDVAMGFHEGTGAHNSHMNVLYGENRFYRHVASHWIEMQQALIAMLIAGVFEFYPTLRVGYLEARILGCLESRRVSNGTIRSTGTATHRICR